MGTPDLPPPAVPAAVYDTNYYRSVCGDAAAFAAGDLGGIHAWALQRLAPAPGEHLVDIGCGRGELLAGAVAAGVRATGVEYSPDAVALARATAPGAEVVLADARDVPLPDGSADAVAMLDVVEHLTAAELAAALAEARRILRPGGRLLIHTMPNRLLYDVTYRALRLVARSWPADPRNDHERRMHVGEQTAGSLRGALREAGFAEIRVQRGEWIHDEFLPSHRARAWLRRAAHVAPLRPLVVANLIAGARRP